MDFIHPTLASTRNEGSSMFIDEYVHDIRLTSLQIFTGPEVTLEVQAAYLYARDRVLGTNWHWLHYHFSMFPPQPLAFEIANLCTRIEAKIPKAGQRLVNSIAGRRNREKDERDYQGILQDFSEILIIDRILSMPWPTETAFFYEPSGRSGRRPELLVSAPDASYLFEVKAPSLLDHQRKRQSRDVQLPTRGIFPLGYIDSLVDERDPTLPRDNPVKDFLVSGEAKFSDFELGVGANILVIVWDDYIYEPISSLVNKTSGLLTEESWFRDVEDRAITFPHVDAIIVVRHLNYFTDALAERPLPDRSSGFDFGGVGALPNVIFPTPWGRPIPNFITEALRAVDFRDESLQNMAEYHQIDLVLWL